MKPIGSFLSSREPLALKGWAPMAPLVLLALSSAAAHASEAESGIIDTVADVMTWVVLVVAPVVGIAVFLLIHVLPEKIAEKKRHPQVDAIKTLCLLSLVFGGMLWPLAWLWAYSKPVLYKIAYGKDAHDAEPVPGEDGAELERLRTRVAELERRSPGGATAADAG
jgi:hypothetical protein